MDLGVTENTQIIAIWGAATGTIGMLTGVFSLWLRYRTHTRDQTKLSCEVSFAYEVHDGRPKPNYKIVVRNVGRRPATLDQVRYYYLPKLFLDRLKRFWLLQAEHYSSADETSINRSTVLPEGQKIEIRIKEFRLEHLGSVTRVCVIDQTGKKWPISWPNQSRLKRKLRHGEIDRHEEENARRICKATAYEISGRFHLFGSWNPEPPNKSTRISRTLKFDTRSELDANWANFRDQQIPKLMKEELDDPF